MAVSELQIVAGVISLLTVALLAMAVKVWWPKKVDEEEASLDNMINGFDFDLPEEVEQYRKFREENPEDVDGAFQALFRRAIADIPLIRKIQSESAGIQRLKKNDILKDGSFMSYKIAEELINEEINDVRREAEELKPGEGWPDRIFPQAVQFMNQMQEQQMMMQRKAAEAQMQAMQAQQQQQMQSVEEGDESAANDEGLRQRK